MKKYLSYAYVIFGAACWGFIGLFNRMLGDLGVTVWNRVTIRNFLSLVLMTVVFALVRRSVFCIRVRHLRMFAFAGFLTVLCLAFVYLNC